MDLRQYVEAWQDRRVLVAGDLCVDRWIHYRTSARKNPESDLPIWEVKSETESLGMAGLVAAMVDALGGEAVVIQDDGWPMSEKIRSWIDGKPLPRIDRDRKATPLRCRVVKLVDCILLCDYGKGAIDRETVAWLVSLAEHWGIPAIVDPARESWDKYQGITAIKCNSAEWKAQRESDCRREIRERYSAADVIVVTDGERGYSMTDGGKWSFHQGGNPIEHANAVGAGDQFLAALGLAKTAGASWPDACRIANASAGVKCRHERTEPCTLDELTDELASDAVRMSARDVSPQPVG